VCCRADQRRFTPQYIEATRSFFDLHCVPLGHRDDDWLERKERLQTDMIDLERRGKMYEEEQE